jgi:hypothetical protein
LHGTYFEIEFLRSGCRVVELDMCSCVWVTCTTKRIFVSYDVVRDDLCSVL